MKKLQVFVAMIVFMLFLVSCNDQTPDSTSSLNSDTEPDTTVSIQETTGSDSIVTVPDSTLVDFKEDPIIIDGEGPIFPIFDLEEYSDYVNTHEMPDWFIYYEDISDYFGMKEFQFHDFLYDPKYKSYSYDSGKYDLKINHDNSLFSRDLYELDDSQFVDQEDSNLSSLANGKGFSVYIYEEVEYTYVNADLRKIAWKCNGVYFALYPSSYIFESNPSNTFVYELLRKRSVAYSIQTFEQSLIEKAAERASDKEMNDKYSIE